MIASWQESYDKPIQCVKKQRRSFANKCPYSQSYGLARSHEWMRNLDIKDGRALKDWYFWTVVLKTLESPLESKKIKSVNLKGSQSWILFGRSDAEAPIFWPPDAYTWLIGKDPDAGKDWGQEEKRLTRKRWLDGITNSLEMNLGNSGRWWGTEKSGVLQSMGRKELDTTWWLNNNKNKWMHLWEIKVTWPFLCIAFFLDTFMQFFLCYTFIPFYFW